MKKSLIAYYSRRGQNYVGGSLVDLKLGNTEIIAQKIQASTGSQMFKIDTVKKYPADYMETTRIAKQELRENARPELTEVLGNMDDYNVIYLGYPNWWGTFPMAVFTFLDSYDFSGKTIIPFCTHEGSGMGGVNDIKKLCPGAKVENGIAIHGGSVQAADRAIVAWLSEYND
ncbi:flavodoxin [uncultured Draconibacterium sp.]|uniref:flavodoxin n=1 Tax=uncultured Draconibacterium sp. TaxID=1573823 RepID=UPI0032162168